MKAIIQEKYGSPEVLQLKEVEKPIPGDDEVLVKVHAASVNSWDWDRLTGKPRLYRLLSGVMKPKLAILGADVAGKVEAVGQNVKRFKPGDEVFGDLCEGNWGAFAEYVSAPEDALILKPSVMSYEEAAAVPQAGVMALQSIRDKGMVKQGQKVLINGAGGGVGTFAVQLARLYGAEVTGVDSAAKLEMLRSIGAQHVIDYTKENFTKNGISYDLIVDVVANRSIFDYRRALNRGGIFVMVGGTPTAIMQVALLGPLISMFGSEKLGILVQKPNKDLEYLTELIQSGKVKPVIDRRYPLSQAPEALQRIGEGRVLGKVIITLTESS
ncbi:MAG: zinc-binding dehydrogenase [candidate division Zixibacteria bacterium]|nr:zinc-binding dehydrogenase [candidate division Zixibacteria bacterium]